MQIIVKISIALTAILAGCATTEKTNPCSVDLKTPLRHAMTVAEEKLVSGCEAYYEGYVTELIDIAIDNPKPDNKIAFSDFLVALSEQGTISKRQAKDFYNRYFNVTFVALYGEYSTCSQVCPIKQKVLLDLREELQKKETGLLKISDDANSYHLADLLMKKSEIVLEATCMACSQ